jgi:hypothetical protein
MIRSWRRNRRPSTNSSPDRALNLAVDSERLEMGTDLSHGNLVDLVDPIGRRGPNVTDLVPASVRAEARKALLSEGQTLETWL